MRFGHRYLTHLCREDSYHNYLGRSISYIRGIWLVLLLSCFVEISELNANSVDPDQTPRFAVSDLGLHCFQCPFDGTLGLNGLRPS